MALEPSLTMHPPSTDKVNAIEQGWSFTRTDSGCPKPKHGPSAKMVSSTPVAISKLEKALEHYSEGSHNSYRVYMSAEPAPIPESHIIPQGILESSIKITNEPPTGMLANLHKALDNFNQVCNGTLTQYVYMLTL